MKYFIYSIITIVTASVIAGFFVIGSPKEERLRRFDEQRVGDLQMLQSGIINYYLAKDALPENFAVLAATTPIPMDPESRTAYEYSVKNKDTFSLCATFALPSIPYRDTYLSVPKVVPGSPDETTWDHDAGRTCFEKRIDKDFYTAPRPF